MTFHIAQGWTTPFYHWSDPDVFLRCDNPDCKRPWVTGTGLVCRALHDERPLTTLFTERLLIACDATCLAAAQQAKRERAEWDYRSRPYWSNPESVERWLEALRDSLTRDPETTPVGEIIPAIS